MSRQLFRSRDDRMLAGVAGGLAELWDADPSLIRILWVVLVPFTGGFALLAYVIMAFVVPEQDDRPFVSSQPATAPAPPSASPPSSDGGDPAPPSATPGAPADWRSAEREDRAARRAARRARRSGRGGAGLLIGSLLVVAGIYFLVREYLPNIDLNWLWPAGLIGLGVVILLSAFRRPPSDPTGPDGP
jgi:phage shock protein C